MLFHAFSQDIFNHVINDLEIFLAKMSAAGNAPPLQEDKSKKKKKEKKKSKKNGNILFPVYLSTGTYNQGSDYWRSDFL